MKILILGATGPTGQHLVKQALEQHHQVTALVRYPAKLNIAHDNLSVISGDALDKIILLKALAGQDAVISALGRGQSLKSSDLITKAVNVLIPAMSEMRIKRLIFLSGFGAGETLLQASLIQKIIFKTFLKGIYTDKAKAEHVIRSSNLDWTLVYPVKLNNKPATGNFKVGEKFTMNGSPEISRADVADFMLKQLSSNLFLNKGVIVMD